MILKYISLGGKEVDEMEEKKESPLPMLILMAFILLGGILLARLIIFSE